MLKKLLFALILMAPLSLWAQDVVSGTVYDFEIKTLPLQEVNVKNFNNNQSTKTKASGNFSLAAKIGDVLEFSLNGYHKDTLYLTNLSPKTVFLPGSSTSLKEVKILSAKINPTILAPDPEAKEFKRVEADDYKGKPNVSRAGGLKLNLGYGKYKEQQAKVKDLEEKDQYENEIKSVFTEAYVSDLVKLKGQELKDFMTMYRPPVATVQSNRPFDYKYYTVQAYHKWLKLPPSQRKPPQVPRLKKN
ncbi:hypothetical protein [Pedobacter panaciterrae]|jgi:hypothetical protein|uniref:Carboxypeptidase-like protein n=1 Tax=Pedobacter panaciterrae TaxID=363849 RepID=A0ABU8NQ85_9SPHI|nr:hypothetical protein [uncultured Pedobacter sp.]